MTEIWTKPWEWTILVILLRSSKQPLFCGFCGNWEQYLRINAVICIYNDTLFSISTTKVTWRLRIAPNTCVMKIAEYFKLNPFQTKIKLASNIHWKSKSIIKLIKRSKHIYLSMFHVGHDTQMKWSKTLPIKILQRGMGTARALVQRHILQDKRSMCTFMGFICDFIKSKKKGMSVLFIIRAGMQSQSLRTRRRENQKIPKIFLFKDVWNRKSLLWFLYVMFFLPTYPTCGLFRWFKHLSTWHVC